MMIPLFFKVSPLFPLQDILEVTNCDWETLLYAPIYDFNSVACLPSYSRVSVVGTVHSVIGYYLR